MVTTLDVTIPAQLTLALVPDLILMVGAMFLLIFSVWRPESHSHQRSVGIASILLCGITMLACLYWANSYAGTAGPIALDNFRWLMDVVILLGTVFAIAASTCWSCLCPGNRACTQTGSPGVSIM